MLALEYRSSIYRWQLCFVLSFLLFVCLFFLVCGLLQEIIISC